MQFNSNPNVLHTIEKYPPEIQQRIMELRQLIIEASEALEGVEQLIEDLKWGEPSYLTKIGSTVRMGWKETNPDYYCLYFHCQTKLVETFRTLFPNLFTYEGKRAIVFHMNDDIPKNEIKLCVSKALEYHRVKHLPLLGI